MSKRRRAVAPIEEKRGARARERRAAPPRARRPGGGAATPPESGRSPVPIVGIGASAGGLEAFSQLLDGLGASPGVALVLIQHLSPLHESALSTLLAGHTAMPVVQASQETEVEADHVYVIPPNTQMELVDHRLKLTPRPGDHTQYTPIDIFFRSLAESAGNGSIGVVLSGASSDGAIGLREIKAVGGITIAQDPRTALHDAMPRAAISTGAVDLVLSPKDIAHEIARIGRDPYLRRIDADETAPSGVEIDEAKFRRLVVLLRNASGIDFALYKTPTIKRRLRRRMLLQKVNDVEQYLRLLQTMPAEAQRLAQDILIHVTRFFRDPDAFAALVSDVFPEIVRNRPPDGAIRIWISGCATGEEAYSIAISLLEFLGDESASIPLQIFATDVSEAAIEQARSGVYPASIAVDVSPERLRRFFTKTAAGYRIVKTVRELCVFARQDLTRDPPFSKLDLVVCRNVLIYLGPALQQKLLNVFHYALRGSGFLMLGHAESADSYGDLFERLDKRHRLYRRRADRRNVIAPLAAVTARGNGGAATNRGFEPHAIPSYQSEAQRLLLERYAPPGVVVDDNLGILHFIGHTGRYLEPTPGEAKLSLPKMLRESLLHALRTAFHRARRDGSAVRTTSVHLRAHGQEIDLALEVVPFGAPAGKDRRYLVLFHETAAAAPAKGKSAKRSTVEPSRVGKLEQELAATREYLQSIIQELEAANEELQSANEEMLSSAEELQSTNEELDTAKEELQSTNEELNTMNDELHGRNEELSRVNSDLVNLLNSVECAIVIVQSDLRIRRFTSLAESLLNLRATDVGRPIGHIKPNIDCPDLEQMVRQVIETVTPQQRELHDNAGRWVSIQVRPYKDGENRIDGAVITLFDIDESKRYQMELRAARDTADAVFDTVREPLLVLDPQLRVQRANNAFCALVGFAAPDVVGKRLHEVGAGEWNVAPLRQALDGIYRSDAPMERFDLTIPIPHRGATVVALNARKVERDDGGAPLILLAIDARPGPAG